VNTDYKALPAVVLSSPHHVGLGITRSLGRLGIRVYNVDSNRWAPAFFSKYCAGRSRWDFESAPTELSLAFLTELAGRIGSQCVVIPTTDTTAIFVADHSDALRKSYVFTTQDPQFIRSLCNKSEMYSVARKAGIPMPETHVPRTRSELLACFEESNFPLMIKSVDSRFRKRRSKTKMLLRDRQAAFALYERIQDEAIGKLIVQDWIPAGPDNDWMFNGYVDKRWKCVAAFTGRKIRQYPPHTGVTSLGMCERNDTLERIATDFLTSLRYRGAVDMDFRYDERDETYKLLDVNPRIGGSFRLFVSQEGLDIARMLYLDQAGYSLAPARLVRGRKWAVEDYDIAAAPQYCWGGTLSTRDWMKSLKGIQEFGFFSRDDLFPALLMLRDDLWEVLGLFENARRPVAPFENNPCAMTEISFSNSPASQGEL
jgi:D-aspartate ligase